MTAQTHVHRRSGEAPGGVLLDVATVETIETTAPAEPPAIPDAAHPPEPPVIVHRIPKVAEPAGHPQLMESDLAVDFAAPATASVVEEAPPGPVAWTPETGFVEPRSDSGPGGMRLVGQRGDFGDALAGLRGDEPDDRHDDEADEIGEASIRYVPEPGPRTVVADVPSDVARVVERATGVAVGDARIDRSPAVSARAAAMGALAFTESGVVHLPEELGSLHDPTNRAIVAHELTHVAQQRRLGPATPGEQTPDGGSLEAEAVAVQRSVWSGRPVKPAVLRDRASIPVVPSGVQRLRDDDDPYEWQERGDGGRFAATREAFDDVFGFDLDDSEEQEREEREWSDNFEEENAADLQAMRDERWLEIYRAARREAIVEARRLDRPAPPPFDDDDIVALRERLDDEMPYEFGPPTGIDPYPGVLPPDDDEDDEQAGATTSTGAGGDTEQGTRRLRSTSSTPPEIGRASVSGRSGLTGGGRGPAGRGTGRSEERDYDWQNEGPTTSQVGSAMFSQFLGGALGGVLGGLFGGDEDDDDEREAEETRRLPQLMPRRHGLERDLRHRRLHDEQTRQVREGGSADDPVSLTDEQITAIREQVDEEMPLEFAIPEYLPDSEDASFADGDYGPQLDLTPGEGTEEIEGELAGEGDETEELAGELDVGEPVEDTGEGDETGVVPAAAATATAGAATTTFADDDDEDDIEGEAERGESAAANVFENASDFDMDLLANRLYSRLRRDLRRELLIDRERAGALADIR